MLREGYNAVVLDLDGTVTDPERTSAAFADRYVASLSKITHVPLGALQEMTNANMHTILAHPEDYNFVFDNFIVSSANDPYFLVQTAAIQALGTFKKLSPEEKALIGYQAFTDSYPSAPIYFREGAKEALGDLLHAPSLQTFSVTNSSTQRAEKIFQKLLGDSHDVTIIGNAQKMTINPKWHRRGMPAEMHILDSKIPALLQRQLYFNALFAICKGDFQRIDSVWGDNGRLDLIVPHHLKSRGKKRGIFTGLITSALTNPLERQYFAEGENSTAVDKISDIPQNIDQRRLRRKGL